jgi:hypothetical protein
MAEAGALAEVEAPPIEARVVPEGEAFNPTLAADFKRPQTWRLVLPSGLQVKARKPNLFFLAQTGQVDPKVKRAQEKQAKNDAAKGADPETGFTADSIVFINLMADFMICKAIIEPRVSMNPEKGAICVDDIDAGDKMFLVQTLDLKIGG